MYLHRYAAFRKSHAVFIFLKDTKKGAVAEARVWLGGPTLGPTPVRPPASLLTSLTSYAQEARMLLR